MAWAFTTGHAANWHPLTWLSLMLDYQLFGNDPRGYHAVNLALHIGNVVLVFVVLSRMTGAIARSALVAALFAVHPLRVESVAWVAERKDVLCALFGLAAIAAYASWVRSPGRTDGGSVTWSERSASPSSGPVRWWAARSTWSCGSCPGISSTPR